MNKKIILMLCFCLMTFMAQAKTDERKYRYTAFGEIDSTWEGDGNSSDDHHICSEDDDWNDYWVCVITGNCPVWYIEDEVGPTPCNAL